MTRNLLFILAVAMFAGAATADPQDNAAFPGLVVDKEAIRYLEKAEELYTLGNYKRAYFIYRNELARIGDKYAQYMVGYMHLTGQGTDQDRVAATAWYRLAAERGTREFVTVHNQLLVSLTPEQVIEYERVFVDLRKRYGDLPLLMQAVRDDYNTLRERTGSRLGSRSSPVTVIDMSNRGTVGSADEYYKKVEDRLKTRLEMMGRYTEIEIIDFDVGMLNLDEIQQQVNLELESAD